MEATPSVGTDPTKPPGCSVVRQQAGQASVYFNRGGGAACGAAGASAGGNATSLVALQVDLAAQATITVRGPADKWFGVAFNATEMKAAPWALIFEAQPPGGGSELCFLHPGGT